MNVETKIAALETITTILLCECAERFGWSLDYMHQRIVSAMQTDIQDPAVAEHAVQAFDDIFSFAAAQVTLKAHWQQDRSE